MNVKKCSISLVAAVALSATYGLRAEIIVPENPVNLLTGRTFITSALYLHEGTGANTLFDGKVATRFITKPQPNPQSGVTPTAIIHFQDGALMVNAYRVCGYTSEGTANRYPKAWALFGSNDGGATWVKLDEQSGQTNWAKGESRLFSFDNIESYSSFKFEILANNGNADYTVIGELELFNFERTDLLEVGYTGYRVGTPKPFYGGVAGLTENASVVLDCPVTRANDVDTGDYYTLQGFTIADHDGTVLKGGTVADLPYTYSHHGYAKLTWNWKSHIDEMNASATDDITVPKNDELNEITAGYTSKANPGEVPSRLFDNSLDTRWLAESISITKEPNWVQYRFLDGPRIVTGIWMKQKTKDDTSRLPQDFIFQGSNDGENFIDLLSVSDAGKTAPSPENRTYTFHNATPYTCYRLYVTKSNNATWLEIGEMEMYTIYRPDSIRVVGEPKSYGHPNPDYGFQMNLVGGTVYEFTGPTETLTVSDDQVSVCDGYTLYINGVSEGLVASTSCRYVHVAGDVAILTWHFTDSYRQAYETKGGGNVSVSEQWGVLGSVVSVTASVGDNGAPFVGWVGDVPEGQEQNPTITYAIDGPRKLTAMFAMPLYVDAANGSDEDNDGTAPDKAFASLQKAFAECLVNGSITVAPGTYPVDGGALAIDKNIALTSVEGPERTFVEVREAAPGFAMSVDAGATVSGFTFRGGTSDDGLAGGLRIYSGTVTNCVVANCEATASGSTGGGVYMYGTGSFLGSTVSNCTCKGNGGGLFLTGGTVRGCRLLDNTATGVAGGANVGGVLNVAFDNCEIVGNKASTVYTDGFVPGGLLLLRPISVGGLDVRHNKGGGVYLIDGASLHDSTVIGNAAARGGGVYAPKGTIERCVIAGNTSSQFGGGVFIADGAIRNCLVTCNTNNNSNASYGGGGIFCRSAASVVNCTVTKNVAQHGQGIWIDGPFALRNSIVSHNIHYLPGGVVTNVYGWHPSTGVRVGGEAGSIHNSCVNDDCYLAYPAFSNNHSIVTDPLFVDAADGDYHLRVGSPCVNGGAMLDYTAESLDLAHQPRVFNFGKRSSKPDMGCYESPYGTPGMLLLFR